MLPDPLKLSSQDAPAFSSGFNTSFISCPVIDPGATLGKTVRQLTVGGFPATLTISHSETKESKPYGTKRLNIRLDFTKSDSEGVLSPAQGFVQITLGQPKGLVTNTDMSVVSQRLCTLLLFGDAIASTALTSDGVAFQARLLNGEG